MLMISHLIKTGFLIKYYIQAGNGKYSSFLLGVKYISNQIKLPSVDVGKVSGISKGKDIVCEIVTK